MTTINTRDELVSFLYDGSDYYDTLVGVVRIGGELLAEAMANKYRVIECFFYAGDEGEYIEVDADGNVVDDSIYY